MLPSLPSSPLHLAALRLIAETAPEPGPALIWVETRAILVQLPPLQPLEASLYIVFLVLSHTSVPGLLARPAVGCCGLLPSQCAVCHGVAPVATVRWNSWCPLWHFTPDLQGRVYWVTSVLVLLPPSWWGWATGRLLINIPGAKQETAFVPVQGTSLSEWLFAWCTFWRMVSLWHGCCPGIQAWRAWHSDSP